MFWVSVGSVFAVSGLAFLVLTGYRTALTQGTWIGWRGIEVFSVVFGGISILLLAFDAQLAAVNRYTPLIKQQEASHRAELISAIDAELLNCKGPVPEAPPKAYGWAADWHDLCDWTKRYGPPLKAKLKQGLRVEADDDWLHVYPTMAMRMDRDGLRLDSALIRWDRFLLGNEPAFDTRGAEDIKFFFSQFAPYFMALSVALRLAKIFYGADNAK
jgi:hypothetical protein